MNKTDVKVENSPISSDENSQISEMCNYKQIHTFLVYFRCGVMLIKMLYFCLNWVFLTSEDDVLTKWPQINGAILQK